MLSDSAGDAGEPLCWLLTATAHRSYRILLRALAGLPRAPEPLITVSSPSMLFPTYSHLRFAADPYATDDSVARYQSLPFFGLKRLATREQLRHFNEEVGRCDRSGELIHGRICFQSGGGNRMSLRNRHRMAQNV
jgi:hypothetical protein